MCSKLLISFGLPRLVNDFENALALNIFMSPSATRVKRSGKYCPTFQVDFIVHARHALIRFRISVIELYPVLDRALAARQRHQTRRAPAPTPPSMRSPLHRPVARAGEGDVSTLDHDLALAGCEGDAVAGLDADFVGGALHGQVFV